MTDLTRRDALLFVGACAACVMAADLVEAADDKGAPAAKAKSVEIGTLADYDKPGFYDKFIKQKVLVARLDDRLVAVSNVCTHKGCAVKVKPDDHTGLKCPCHKAEFSPEGTPTSGPAKTALARYAIKQGADGKITVDLTKQFIESKWDDADAFVAVKKA